MGARPVFHQRQRQLPETFNSGGCVGFADLDGDGYDDLVILDQSRSLHTLYQATDGSFTDYALGNVSGPASGECAWEISTTTGTRTCSVAVHDGVHLMHITAPGKERCPA